MAEKAVTAGQWNAAADVFKTGLAGVWNTFDKYLTDKKVDGHYDNFKLRYDQVTK